MAYDVTCGTCGKTWLVEFNSNSIFCNSCKKKGQDDRNISVKERYYDVRCKQCGHIWSDNTHPQEKIFCTFCQQRKRGNGILVVNKTRKNANPKTFNERKLLNHSMGHNRKPRKRDRVTYENQEDSSEEEDENDKYLLLEYRFNPSMRFSIDGTYKHKNPRGVDTDIMAKSWVNIREKIKRVSAYSVMKESAKDYATRHHVESEAGFEWCHMIAVSLGGLNRQDNIFCANYHANTAMLCIEGPLQGRADIQIEVELSVRRGTCIAETITYRIRKSPNKRRKGNSGEEVDGKVWSVVIDGLASGCNKTEGGELSTEVNGYIGKKLI